MLNIFAYFALIGAPPAEGEPPAEGAPAPAEGKLLFVFQILVM